MSTETAEVISAARALPLEARSEIVDNLVDSLYDEDDASNIRLKEIVEARLAAYRRGGAMHVPMETVFEKAAKLVRH